MALIDNIIARAKSNKQRIVLPESFEERTITAADQALRDDLAEIILIGNREKVLAYADELGLKNIDKATIIDPATSEKTEEYIQLLFQLRQKKGMTLEVARKTVLENPLYFGCLIIKSGDADGQISGALSTTGDTLRPALQIIKCAPGISCVSGAMLLITQTPQYGEEGVLVMGDIAVTPMPDAAQLAQIAVCTAQTAKSVAGFEDPRVAMLSFSTKGSAKHEVVDKVVEATRLAKELEPKEGWVKEKVECLCDILDKYRKPISKRDRKVGIYPYYGASCVQDYVDDFIFDGRYLLIGEDGAKWGSGDNTAYIVEGKFWVNNHAHIVKCKENVKG